jgi:tetratricopeptide (TPR) repeat protein
MLERRLMNAAQAYERDRYKEALSAIKPVVDAVPDSAAARELYGLTLYRLDRWRQAAAELRRVHEMTGSFDQHPVIADCERAMGRIEKVRQLWDELRKEGVDKDVLVEGRLVMAGALADAGELEQAIVLLQPAARHRKHADVPVLREWYALADLYELAGDLPRARELFARVAAQAPDLLDAPDRLRAIR